DPAADLTDGLLDTGDGAGDPSDPSDTDLVLDADLGLPVAGDLTADAEVGLDPVEALVGDIDLDLGADLDLSGAAGDVALLDEDPFAVFDALDAELAGAVEIEGTLAGDGGEPLELDFASGDLTGDALLTDVVADVSDPTSDLVSSSLSDASADIPDAGVIDSGSLAKLTSSFKLGGFGF
ncbi:hypothetical protein, partial [Mangrovibrevibacter kandeliae]|uniref:hypothetical protein n=1 Tax=Mangrovibrevibacter kandeliae TaxID=2968473 RepID=UPI002117E26B